MLLVIGLGNPGKKYEETRHNLGFMMLEKMKELWKFPDFEPTNKFLAQISKGKRNGQEIILAKPETFMNLSGDAVRKILNFYKLTPDDLVVVHDDLDVTLGKYKIALDSSSAGHNGVEDIIEKIGTQKFRRLRLGINNFGTDGSSRPEASQFVLENFSSEEIVVLNQMMEELLKKLEELI